MRHWGRIRSPLVLRVHLDTDIGGDLDDICALAFLLRCPDVELVGVTTVIDDGGRRAGYARRALALAGRNDLPVAAGADVSLGRFAQPTDLPPEEHFWPSPVTPMPGPLDAALDLLAASIANGATVLAIGPLTNLALLEARQPGALQSTTLVVMGGHVRMAPTGYPQWDHTVDYNIQADPAAAVRVLEAASPTLVPIEVSAQTALRRADLAVLRQGDPLAQLLAHQSQAFAPSGEEFINYLHDPLAAAVAIGWSGVTIESLPLSVTVHRGWLRMREDQYGRQCRVVTAVEAERFNRYWLDTVTNRS